MGSMSDFETGKNLIRLDGIDNYQIWKFQLKVLINANGFADIADGSLKLCDIDVKDTSKVFKWKKDDARVQQFIVTSLSKEILIHIMTCATSYEMLSKLQLLFEKDTDQQRCSLLSNFYNLKFDCGTSLLQQIADLESLTFRLKALQQDISEEMLIAKIISALPPEYNFFKSAWESTELNQRTVANLISRLTAEEERTKVTTLEGNAFNAAKSTSKSEGNSRYCTHCKMNNHNMENCFKL